MCVFVCGFCGGNGFVPREHNGQRVKLFEHGVSQQPSAKVFSAICLVLLPINLSSRVFYDYTIYYIMLLMPIRLLHMAAAMVRNG